MDTRDGVIENHAITVLPTVGDFADVARALGGRGGAAADIGLVALEATLRSSDAGRSVNGRSGEGAAGATFALLPGDIGGHRIAVSAGHAFDRLADALRGGVTDFPSALAVFVARRDAERLAAAVGQGGVLLWTMTTSVESASWIAATLLARSAERVCTFARPRSPPAARLQSGCNSCACD